MIRPRPLPSVLIGTAVGISLAVLGGASDLAWRGPAVGAACGLLVVGLRRLADLAGREWRRERPSGRRYLAAIAPIATALLLAALATA